jgi:hypothetical protein
LSLPFFVVIPEGDLRLQFAVAGVIVRRRRTTSNRLCFLQQNQSFTANPLKIPAKLHCQALTPNHKSHNRPRISNLTAKNKPAKSDI